MESEPKNTQLSKSLSGLAVKLANSRLKWLMRNQVQWG